MKRPQRDFVVEFKTGRRRAVPKKDSIWGETNIEALLRAAEEDAPHLFAPKAAPVPMTVTGPETEHQEIPPVSLDRSIDPEASQAHELPAVPQATTGVDTSARVEPPIEPSKPRGAKPKTALARKPKRTPPVDTTPVGAAPARVVDMPVVGRSVVSMDELDMLEAENRRLKGLLVERLRDENSRLQAMLGRFQSA